MKFAPNNFDTIIFDMDGVITSELSYWQTAALTCYDLLINYEHYGVCGIDKEWCRRQYIEIYNTVLCGGRTVKAVKALGVNTNWDLAYIVFCVSKYLNPDLDTLDASHFQSVCMFIENIDLKAPHIYDTLGELVKTIIPKDDNYFKRGIGHFWKELCDTFELWYLGSSEFEGVNSDESLLFPAQDIEKVLKTLTESNIRLGIGTGRPRAEIEYPLTKYGLYKYFDKSLCVCYDEVLEAENEIQPKNPLSKPDPFVFLKAALGEKHTNREIFDGDYTYGELERTLIVGDSPSDLIAAQKGGFNFLAVLTGIDGENGMTYFQQNKADYILNSILDMI